MKTGGVSPALDRPLNRRIIDLGGVTAILTDQELTNVIMAGMLAPDIGLEGFDLMHQTMGLQKLQRPIHRRRRDRAFIRRQGRENIIGADRHMAFPDDLQHPAALTGQTRAAHPANCLRARHGTDDAMGVIVFGVRERSLKALVHDGIRMR